MSPRTLLRMFSNPAMVMKNLQTGWMETTRLGIFTEQWWTSLASARLESTRSVDSVSSVEVQDGPPADQWMSVAYKLPSWGFGWGCRQNHVLPLATVTLGWSREWPHSGQPLPWHNDLTFPSQELTKVAEVWDETSVTLSRGKNKGINLTFIVPIVVEALAFFFLLVFDIFNLPLQP